MFWTRYAISAIQPRNRQADKPLLADKRSANIAPAGVDRAVFNHAFFTAGLRLSRNLIIAGFTPEATRAPGDASNTARRIQRPRTFFGRSIAPHFEITFRRFE